MPRPRISCTAFISPLPLPVLLSTPPTTHVSRWPRRPLCCANTPSPSSLPPSSPSPHHTTVNDYIFHRSSFSAHRASLRPSPPPSTDQSSQSVPSTSSSPEHPQNETPHMTTIDQSPPNDPTTTTTAATTTEDTDFETLMHEINGLQGDPLQPEGGRIVTYRGNPSARVVIIGEAPGEREDELRIPFVGPSGQLLDNIFLYAGFDIHHQLYITNIAKRRPPNNRNPTASEIASYLPLVRRELAAVRPRIVVCAGAVASKAVLGKQFGGITKDRGKWFQAVDICGEDAVVMPVFHPSYLLRKPSMKQVMLVDIHNIRDKFMQVCKGEELRPIAKRPSPST